MTILLILVVLVLLLLALSALYEEAIYDLLQKYNIR